MAAIMAAMAMVLALVVPAPASAATRSCTASTAVNHRPLLRSGDNGSCVRVLQRSLVSHGVSVGSSGADGAFGPATRRAVRTFQGRHNLTVDGLVGQHTWRALSGKSTSSPKPSNKSGSCQPRQTVRSGSHGSCVRVAQSKLNQHGAGLSVDGAFGPRTRSATIAYQRSVGLGADGIIGPRTWSALDGGRGGNSGGGDSQSPSYNNRRGPNYSRAAVFTFDDCPNNLSKLRAGLNWLEDNNVGAWFFPTGNCITSFQSRYDVNIVSLMRSHGQLVGNHSVSHPDLTTLSYNGAKNQLGSPGVVTNYGRPPYGASNSTVRSAYRAVGMRQVFWTVDTQDWTGKSASQVTSYVINHTGRGDNVLMHMQWNGFTPSAMATMKRGLNNKGVAVCHKSFDVAPRNWPSRVDCT